MNCLICLGIGSVCENHQDKTRDLFFAAATMRPVLPGRHWMRFLGAAGRCAPANNMVLPKSVSLVGLVRGGQDNAVSSVLSRRQGHVFASEVIVAENDEEAMLRAIRLRDRYDIEVWQLDRKVALIKAPK